MKRTQISLKKIIPFLENAPLTPALWLGAFTGLIFTRLMIENWLGDFQYRDIQFLFNEFTHTFLFFLLSYLLFLPLLMYTARVTLKQATNVLLWGFFIILTPPIIDHILSGGQGFWSFYEFDGLEGLAIRFLTFFGEDPTIGITYGVRVEVAVSLLLFATYVFFHTKDLLRTLLSAFLSYSLFFVLGTFPSWATFLILGWSQGLFSINAVDIAGLFLSPDTTLSYTPGAIINSLNAKMSMIYAGILFLFTPLLALGIYRKETLSLLRNIRLPQSIYHAGLVATGGALAYLFSPETLTHSTFFNTLSFLLLMASAILAWLSSVVVNDLYDQDVDALSNPSRPLITETLSPKSYALLGWILGGSSLLIATIAHPFSVIFFLIYHALTWLYNTPPFRLKRFFPLATFIGAIASLMLLYVGYVSLDTTGSTSHIPLSILLLLTIAYTFCLPIKDLKDIQGDKKDGIFTLPVLLGEKKAKLLIAISFFFSFIASVVIFAVFPLAPWAFFFGSLAFWSIISAPFRFRSFSLTYRNLPLILITLVFFYGLVLAIHLL